MLRKIMLATLLVGLIGILVTGAVTRTIDRTKLVAEAQGRGRGNGEAGAYAASGASQGRGGYSQGNARNGVAERQYPNYEASPEEWLTIQGTVVSVDADTLVVQTVSGEQVTVENRAWWFAQEQGLSAQVGDQVTLIGFYEGSDLEVGQINDATNGQTVLVRDENGRPLWAGRGRQGG